MATFPQLEGVEHRTVQLPGLRMHVAEAGQGEPVLLLHGFPQTWWEWRYIIRDLAATHRVICPDLRGAGATDAPADGYARPGQDLLDLLDALGIEQAHVVAHDWAAMAGYELCLRHPERVLSYVSLAVPHPWMRFSPKLLTVMWRLWFQYAIATPGLGPWLLRRGGLVRYLLRAYAVRPLESSDVDIFVAQFREPARARAGSALYRRFILPGAMRIARGAYRGMRLRTPTRLLYGADDPARLGEFLGGYEEHADGLTIVRVEDASHFLADEQPAAVLAEIRRALAAAPPHPPAAPPRGAASPTG